MAKARSAPTPATDQSVQARIDEEVDLAYFAQVRANIVQWTAARRGIDLTLRAKDRLLRIAEQKASRAGRIRGAVDEQGRSIDFNVATVNTMKREIGQLWHEHELLDVLIAEAQAELAGLPVPPEDGE